MRRAARLAGDKFRSHDEVASALGIPTLEVEGCFIHSAPLPDISAQSGISLDVTLSACTYCNDHL